MGDSLHFDCIVLLLRFVRAQIIGEPLTIVLTKVEIIMKIYIDFGNVNARRW